VQLRIFPGNSYLLALFGGVSSNLDGWLSFDFPIPTETSANHSVDRSGGSGEHRKHLKIEECGFLPKAATPVLQRSPTGLKHQAQGCEERATLGENRE
jgi:hypothetical protein